jgi:Leucine-rich repeat (LRR) protein
MKNRKKIEMITSIIINNQKLKNIDLLCDENLINLQLLVLVGNYIEDITPLKKAKFINIKYINLQNNKINNKNIAFLPEIKFKELFYLNLSFNNLDDFTFFENLYQFKSLTKLYMAGNNFKSKFSEYKSKNNNKNKFDSFPSIKELGLSNGVFSDYSIKILCDFNISKLKVLYLNRNNLSSLSFVEKLECLDLEEIWLNNNYIKDFRPLIKFKKLKVLQLMNNLIDNIDNLIDFIKILFYLEKINITGNKINFIEGNNNNIVDYIKSKTTIKFEYDN